MSEQDIQARIDAQNRERAAKAQAEAEEFTRDLLQRLRDGEVNRSDNYSDEEGRYRRIMLAGNGPTAWAYFLYDEDGDLRTTFVSFFNGEDTGLVHLGEWRAEELLEALQRD